MSDELSLIQKQIDELEAKKKALVEQNRSQALSEVRKLIALYGFTAGELGVGISSNTAVDSSTKKPRRSSEQRQADEKAKHDKSVTEARAAFGKVQVRKFTNAETGISKYYYAGKKGLTPAGEGVVVTAIEEIV